MADLLHEGCVSLRVAELERSGRGNLPGPLVSERPSHREPPAHDDAGDSLCGLLVRSLFDLRRSDWGNVRLASLGTAYGTLQQGGGPNSAVERCKGPRLSRASRNPHGGFHDISGHDARTRIIRPMRRRYCADNGTAQSMTLVFHEIDVNMYI